MKGWLMFLCFLQGCGLLAQNYVVSGRITDVDKNPLSFVNVLVYDEGSADLKKGTTTDEDGSFILNGLEGGNYKFQFSYIGFEDTEKTLTLSSNRNLGTIVLQLSSEMLDETVVTTRLPSVRKTPGKLVFEVENTSFSVGSTIDLLKRTPGVIVIGENIQVKLASTVIFINGKRVYLSASEVYSLLENTDAASIKAVEVITNPSSKYDADAGVVLNILTSKAISIGYKGSIDGKYEQGIYPKYSLGTAHFYKNDWLNVYASYAYSERKEYKEDENFINYFEPDQVTTKSIWETTFNRTSESQNHTGKVILDFTLDEKNTISLSSNILITPKIAYENHGSSLIFNPERQLDTTVATLSYVNYDKSNLTLALDYNRTLNDKGATLAISSNYIYYDYLQNQSVASDYNLADGTFLRNTRFSTDSRQHNNIFTAQADISTELWGGTFDMGVKFSNIDTDSKLNYFNLLNNAVLYNNTLSDDFNYKENIYSEYINFEREWEKWSLIAGVRGEFTDIQAISRSLGEVNAQDYFQLFPSASFHYSINEDNGLGLSYNRSVQRPRYQSLNPFKYFITERNYLEGNPTLVPAIEDKITLSYDFKNKLFFELYFQNIENSLDNLVLQDNENSTLIGMESNMIKSYQYSFDITYFDSLTSWWWLHLNTSSFYLATDFYALLSAQEKYKNDTFGQYIFLTNNFTLSKDRTFTADLTTVYISNFVYGNRYFKNQNYVNISFRKNFWDKRASFTVGVDDIFNTLNQTASASKYYNQDNYFYARQENRLFRVGFKYDFGNARLRDNSKKIETEEGERLEGK